MELYPAAPADIVYRLFKLDARGEYKGTTLLSSAPAYQRGSLRKRVVPLLRVCSGKCLQRPVSRQILDNLPRNQQSRNGGNEGDAARNISPFGAFVLCSGRADTVRPTADRQIINWPGWLFFRINDL